MRSRCNRNHHCIDTAERFVDVGQHPAAIQDIGIGQ